MLIVIHLLKANLRTLGEVREYHKSYVRNKRRNAPKYKSCVNEPLIPGKDTDEILDLIPPPSLHLLLGVANTLLDKLQEKWDQAYTWAESHGITRKNYHGGKMEGHQCEELLKKAHILERDLPRCHVKYACAMLRFYDVVQACFREELQPDFLIVIQRFRKSYESLGINITPKVHAVFEHVGEFCKRKNEGLAKYAEQASESVHHDFKTEWERFKYDMSHSMYPERLRSCVVTYNSKHL